MTLNSTITNDVKKLHGILSAHARPPVVEELTVLENGIYFPQMGVDGFSKVTVSTPVPPTLETLNVIENGEYTPSANHAYNQVNVNVPTPIHNYVSNAGFWSFYTEGPGQINQTELNKMNITWNGSTSIGCGLVSHTNLAGNNFSKVIIDVDYFGDSYAHIYNNSRLNFQFSVGLMNVANYNTFPNPEQWLANGNLLAITDFNNITDFDKTNLHQELTFPNNAENVFIFCGLGGLRLNGLKIEIV